jgi:hypothetical protein
MNQEPPARDGAGHVAVLRILLVLLAKEKTLISVIYSCQPVLCTAAGQCLVGHNWEMASLARQFVPPPPAPRTVLATVSVYNLDSMVGTGVKLTIERNRSQS